VCVGRLLHHERADIVVVEGFQAEQGFAGSVALVGVEGEANTRGSFANGLDSGNIVADITTNFDFVRGDTTSDNVFGQFVAVFGCDHRNAHIGFDRSAGTTNEDVERDAVGAGQGIEQGHFHTGDSRRLAEVDAVYQFRQNAPVDGIFAL